MKVMLPETLFSLINRFGDVSVLVLGGISIKGHTDLDRIDDSTQVRYQEVNPSWVLPGA